MIKGRHSDCETVYMMIMFQDFKPYACPVCQYRTGVRGNVDKHIRTVHDLIVVTKHTVQLKMKYPDFNSGDVITKDGHLVATAQERKALQQAPHIDKDGNLVAGMESSPQTGPDSMNVKNENGSYQKYKHVKRSRYSTNQAAAVEVIPVVQTEITSAVANLSSTTVSSINSTTQNLETLSNYVYIHGDSVMTALTVPVEAQDLRLPVVASTSQPDQPTMYTIGNGNLFLPAKYEFQDQPQQ